jgi:hypothetical protein
MVALSGGRIVHEMLQMMRKYFQSVTKRLCPRLPVMSLVVRRCERGHVLSRVVTAIYTSLYIRTIRSQRRVHESLG